MMHHATPQPTSHFPSHSPDTITPRPPASSPLLPRAQWTSLSAPRAPGPPNRPPTPPHTHGQISKQFRTCLIQTGAKYCLKLEMLHFLNNYRQLGKLVSFGFRLDSAYGAPSPPAFPPLTYIPHTHPPPHPLAHPPPLTPRFSKQTRRHCKILERIPFSEPSTFLIL